MTIDARAQRLTYADCRESLAELKRDVARDMATISRAMQDPQAFEVAMMNKRQARERSYRVRFKSDVSRRFAMLEDERRGDFDPAVQLPRMRKEVDVLRRAILRTERRLDRGEVDRGVIYLAAIAGSNRG